ncbi:MAG: T9SS type A sorting domain-containing protein [Cyclobacteriaceae bacterium]
MKQVYLLFTICLLTLSSLQAQDLEWIQTGDNIGNAYVVDFFVDELDTLYAIGQFENTLTLGAFQLESAGGLDIYAVKLDPDRNIMWAFSIGSTGTEIPDEIIVREDGSFILSGLYQNTVDIGGLSMTSDGSYDAFLMDFDSDGNPVSVIENKGPSVVGLAGTGIASNGDYILTGIFLNDATFGGETLTSGGNSFDTYLARYQPDGTLVYVEQISGEERVNPGAGLVLDDNDNIYLGGQFRSNIIVDGNIILEANNPGPNNESRDVWIAKYSGDGTFQWAQMGGGDFEDQSYHLALDGDANVFIVGGILGPGDFGSFAVAGTQGIDSYVAKYDTDGNIIWFVRPDSNLPSNDRARGVEVDIENGVLYVSGRYSGTISWGDFSLSHQSGDEADIYLASFDLDGNALSARQFTGVGFQQSTLVDIGSPGIIYLGGEFQGTLNVESNTFNSTEANTADAVILKLRNCDDFPLSVSISADKEATCSGDEVTFTADIVNGGNNPTIEWYINEEVVQTGVTTLMVDTLSQQSEVYLRFIREDFCREIVNSAPVTIDVDNFEVSVTISSDQTAPVCEGITLNFSSEVRGGGDSPAYQWRINNQPVEGATEDTFTTDQLMADDVVSLEVTSSLPCLEEPTATSNAIFPNIYPILGVMIDENEATGCENGDITLTATLNGEYEGVTYEWLRNGNIVENETSPTIIISSPVDQDVYEVQVSGTEVCYQDGGSVATDNVTLQVSSAITPTIEISADDDDLTIEDGETVTFTATTTNAGGGTTQIEWFVNGITTGETGETYSNSTLTDQSVVTAVLTTDLACATSGEITSDPITITVNQVTGIDLDNINKETRFYPNPMVSVSVLEFPNDQKEAFTFSITDLSGKTVRLMENIKDNSITIEKGQLEPGIYLYRLSSETRVSNGRILVE